MKNNLWTKNHPRNFWLLQPDLTMDLWQEAIRLAIPVLELQIEVEDLNTLLILTLGENQFGSKRYQLSISKRLYYLIKPLLSRLLINQMKRANSSTAQNDFRLQWPIEDRYVRFQWEVAHQLMVLTGERQLEFLQFWPYGKQFSLILTHDIETAKGQGFVREVANLEEKLGFRSSFNFVPERYPIDKQLIEELVERGFEIGLHGLRHDGKLYNSENTFHQRSQAINQYLEKLNSVGFRSPYMQRNPEWMQALNIEYDLSFFDTDPYEPMPGGCMSIWPFTIGHFIELPYTLVQDSTLGYVLGETTPRLWLEKLEFIKKYHGMALLNSHPDYLKDPKIWNIYQEFLLKVTDQNNYWHALPHEVARWWRLREKTAITTESDIGSTGKVVLENDKVVIYPTVSRFSSNSLMEKLNQA